MKKRDEKGLTYIVLFYSARWCGGAGEEECLKRGGGSGMGVTDE
jgi:hypothetical protein